MSDEAQPATPEAVTCDLATSDVHVPSAITRAVPASSTERAMSEAAAPTPQAQPHTMISAAKRKSIPSSQFGDPGARKYPLDTAARVRNAAARLEQQKGSMSPSKYSSIKGRIARAARKFGINSEYNEPKAVKHPSMRGRGTRMAVTHPDGTRVEVRHMSAGFDESKDSLYLFHLLKKSSGDGDGPVWIQLAKSGTFNGHGQGPFRLDAKVFESLIRNFRANPDGRTPIDFEHASEMPPTSGSVPSAGAPAQGWILDLKHDGQNLFALVQWGELARQYIREEKYKFISPAIRFKSKDPNSGQEMGPRLSSAGLTNDPFLKGMLPLVASENAAAELGAQQAESVLASSTFCYSSNEYMPAIKAALRMPELCSAMQCSDHLGMLRSHLASAGGDHTAQPQGVRLSDYLFSLRDIARLPMNASWDQVLDVVQDLIDAAIDEHEAEFHSDAVTNSDDDEETVALSTDDAPTQLSAPSAAEAPPASEPPQPAAAVAVAAEPAREAAVPASAPQPREELTTMSDNQNTQAAPAVPPAATQTITVASVAAAPVAPAAPATSQDVSTLTLSLKLQGVEAENARLLSENAELKRWKVDREQQDQATEVTIAFETYKDSKGLKESDKQVMLSVLASNPEAFRKLYPPVPVGQRHLLTRIAGDSRNSQAPNAEQRNGADAPAPIHTLHSNTSPGAATTMSVRQLSRQIARKKGIPLDQAQLEASRIIRAQRAEGAR